MWSGIPYPFQKMMNSALYYYYLFKPGKNQRKISLFAFWQEHPSILCSNFRFIQSGSSTTLVSISIPIWGYNRTSNEYIYITIRVPPWRVNRPNRNRAVHREVSLHHHLPLLRKQRLIQEQRLTRREQSDLRMRRKFRFNEGTETFRPYLSDHPCLLKPGHPHLPRLLLSNRWTCKNKAFAPRQEEQVSWSYSTFFSTYAYTPGSPNSTQYKIREHPLGYSFGTSSRGTPKKLYQ